MYKEKMDRLFDKYFSGGNIHYKNIFSIVFPILTDQAFLVLMSLINIAMISSAGVTAISAVNMVDSLNIFLINVFIAIATGGTVIIAQYKGSGNKEMVKKTSTQSISACAIFSLILAVLLIVFHTQTLTFLFGDAEKEVFHNARIYLIGCCLSYPFIAVFQSIRSSLIGVGETKQSLKLSLVMNLLNTVLNIIFIKFFDMSVMGLVISIFLSRAIGMLLALNNVTRHNNVIPFKIKDSFHLDYSILKKIMMVGIPFALEQMFFNGGKLLTQTFIVKLGTMALTVNAITGSITSIYQIAPNSLGIALVTIVGQYIGQKNIQDAKKLTVSFLGLSTVCFVVISLLIFPMFSFLMKIFEAPHSIIHTIYIIILISAVAQPLFWSFSFVLPSALRAAGDAKYTSVTSMLSMWLFRVILGYILGIPLHYGIIGVWVAMFLEWGIRSTFFWRRFKGKKWYKHKLI